MYSAISTVSAAVCAAMLVQPAVGALRAQEPAPQQQQQMGGAGMSKQCHAMMASHEEMMKEMKAADAKLDSLVAKMNESKGDARVDAVAEAVTTLVRQRASMRERMMQGQMGMMRHMMEHMGSGESPGMMKKSMGACPMMKRMGGGAGPGV
jgi:hypothetical protein